MNHFAAGLWRMTVQLVADQTAVKIEAISVVLQALYTLTSYLSVSKIDTELKCTKKHTVGSTTDVNVCFRVHIYT